MAVRSPVQTRAKTANPEWPDKQVMDTSGGDSTSTKVNVPTSNKFQLLSGDGNNVDTSDCDDDDDERVVYKQKKKTHID